MMYMTTTGITTPDGGAARAFTLGTRSFGAFLNGRTQTAV